MLHYHHCPTCYDHHQCLMACSIEPDLCDGDRQFGSHCNCSICEREANMFFICDTGEVRDVWSTVDTLAIWRDDNFIFFGQHCSMHSYQIEDSELGRFCDFLVRGSIQKDYQEFEAESDEPYVALEDDDEGSRNLCIRGDRLYFIFNIKTDLLPMMAAFLRKQIK